MIALSRNPAFHDYPFLTKEEFAEACHHFDRRYHRADLGPVRPRWRLSICAALDTNFSVDDEYTTYIQITRPLEAKLEPGDLSGDLSKISLGTETAPVEVEDIPGDEEMIEAEETDEVSFRAQQQAPDPVSQRSKLALPKQSGQHDFGRVTYEIHLHPTYKAPCLWFTLHDLPADQQAFNIDTVFRHLVPDEFKDGLRSTGGVGGISADVSGCTTNELI